MDKQTKMQVEAIKNGTVIDHIPANVGLKILRLFDIEQGTEKVTIGLNLPSSSSATKAKDIIKIENVFLTQQQASQLAIYAPNATVNQIEGYRVVKKLPLALPEVIESVFKCPNSNCITHGEPVNSSFKVIVDQEDVRMKCKYCERTFDSHIMTDAN
ncbi:aspartate carbamoyltransferase regulatory subunit [Oleiphilus sp. HI0009]|uniref:aspartate carbamoyltransferase regulatory subunit n=2 Tax=Oleiphilus TaxID=141450 RepID=UPI0007C20B26|nr:MULTISPECIES: aspartate carbamoyltransferase regulatory subunit [unclassified Oleiphilus]KZX76628.1 aspartate carbamoyltransferase regulatory subunit [Oleiphilus sp. HI0009]KZY61586.1 aspartate carbamoyltransferase regulatory subunit [Oleiphilus sp. HI0066]KZY77246.1 aspartate carbamoyltransferase regulatory subunit [Oleiphilus sp. HI0067]